MEWNRARLVQCAGTRETAINWCRQNGLLADQKMCGRHRTPMSFDGSRGLGVFRCQKGVCNTWMSIAKNSWFEEAKLNPQTILR
jgi:hypothetical protein